MSMLRHRPALAVAAGLFAASAALTPAHAALVQITYDYSVEYSGATPPAGAQPWLRATFDDENTTGSVKVKLEALNLVGTEFVRTWAFNLDPALNPAQLLFSAATKTGSFNDPTIELNANTVNVAAGALMDVGFNFSPGGGTNARFTAGDVLEYTVTGIPTLNAFSFGFLSSGNASLLTAAHVQGIGDDGANSGWVTVPEPASLGLAAVACLPLAARRRRGA